MTKRPFRDDIYEVRADDGYILMSDNNDILGTLCYVSSIRGIKEVKDGAIYKELQL